VAAASGRIGSTIMSTLLALDTSAASCSVALLRAGEVSGRVVDAGGGNAPAHSRLLLPMVDALLAEAGISAGQLDAIAFGAGPGAFTGVRIACAVAQGLGFALERPLLPVGTLRAMASACAAPRVIACLDARMGEVYWAAWECVLPADGTPPVEIEARVAPCVVPPARVPWPAGSGWVGCGDGFALHGPELLAQDDAASRAGLTTSRLARVAAGITPQAVDVLRLAARDFALGLAIAPEFAAPFYVRDKVALDSREQAALRAGAVPAAAVPAAAPAVAAVAARSAR
jgi:tRNA threonylcarbamoyladenosine biosynthesis protein TsaB